MWKLERRPARSDEQITVAYIFGRTWSAADIFDWLRNRNAFDGFVVSNEAGVITAYQYNPSSIDDKTMKTVTRDYKEGRVTAIVGRSW